MASPLVTKSRLLLASGLIAVSALGSLVQAQEMAKLSEYAIEQFGAPPEIPQGTLSADLQAAVDTVFFEALENAAWGPPQAEALKVIEASGDVRIVWAIADMMRFTWRLEFHNALSSTAGNMLGLSFNDFDRWNEITNHLIAWDVPDFPGYLDVKRAIFTRFVPGWDNIFTEGDIDWRMVSWGGVLIDDRPFGVEEICSNCIPAADDPAVSSADEATWLEDDDIVFGVEVNGEYRAYPRQIMEVREMVNDTLGGRQLGIPYCTLCGAAQAYFTDDVPAGVERPVLRTSGLLIRSNKVMYDRNTWSIFDTFLGHAVTGPLADKGVKLEQATVITTDWGTWKKEHPETTVLVEELALGRDFDFRSNRDKNGPIFPVGDIDPRLPVHEDIIGVTTASGTPVAFQRSNAFLALQAGEEIAFENVRLELDAGGIRAVDADGSDLGSHQAFWFAWSQFHPKTELWTK